MSRNLNPPQPGQIERGSARVPEGHFESIDSAKPYDFESNFIKTKAMEADPEFELPNLGIDLQTTSPLLPYVYYIGSDAPLAARGQYPSSIYYPNTPDPTNVSTRIKQFNDFMLLFIFYVHARDKLQVEAAQELTNRKYVYDSKIKVWSNPSGQIFDIHSWSFIDPTLYGKLPR